VAIAIRFREAVSLAGQFPLLAGVTCDVAEGEVVHLRGPNGAGKSSLLRACAGLVPIRAGEAFVLGYDLRSDREDLRREVGLLGHASFLYDELTVEDNLRFAIRAARRPLDHLEPALDKMELPSRVRKARFSQLSTGQRRRVTIAAFIARTPRLWLLDEPHAGLDASARDILDTLIVDAAQSGATVLLASHEFDRAAEVADRAITMSGGQIIAAQSAATTTTPISTKDGGRDVA